MLEIKVNEWQQLKPLAHPIRQAVFIDEQGIPAKLEWDEYDEYALHALALLDGRAVGTGRLLENGQIGRVAVMPDYRNQGIASAILYKLIDCARQKNMPRLYLDAQLHLVDFYRKFGFETDGNPFMEAGIPHQRMTRKLSNND
jgi:predicted GNAT family N-acyltransferase